MRGKERYEEKNRQREGKPRKGETKRDGKRTRKGVGKIGRERETRKERERARI